MSSNPIDLYHCGPKGASGICIWWIDDCFHSASAQGGNLPIQDIRRKREISTFKHQNSGTIYQMLLGLTQDEIGLCFCSHEYAEAHWDELNSSKNILLIDVGYEGQDNADTFGLDFYSKMLNRMSKSKKEMQAESAFFTVKALIAQEHLTKRGWDDFPPLIDKTGESKQLPHARPGVEALIQKVREKEQFALQQQTITSEHLVKELLRAQFDGEVQPIPGHPLRPQDIPHDVLLASEFRADDSSGLESYKALYYISENDVNAIREKGIYNAYYDLDRRSIRIGILSNLLQRCGMAVETSLSDREEIQLAIAPGMLFVICLVDFLRTAQINCVTLVPGSGDQASSVVMKMQIKDPVRFESAIMTGGGSTASMAFRRLLACKKDKVEVAASEEQRQVIQSTWPPQLLPLEHGKSRVYWAILKWRVEGSTLVIWWPSATGSTDPW